MKRSNRIAILLLIVICLTAAGCTKKEQSPILNVETKQQETKVLDIEPPKQEPVKEEPKQEEKKPAKEIEGLVKLEDLDSSFVIDLRYASENNFTGKKVYPVNVCVLRKETAEKLIKANEEFKKQGYRIKIWDAYRPPYVQKIFWDMVKDSRFVANPNKGGSKHNIGTAVDMTLVDSNGKELNMPTGFDDFSKKAYRDNANVSKEVRKNVDLLTNVMKKSGFIPLNTEWWHFDDSDSNKYKIVDVKIEKFID